MKYRAQITCGNNFESLEPDYDKQYNLIVDDPELDTFYDPCGFSSAANSHHYDHYEVECKFCKKYIRLPSTVWEISLSARAYMNFNGLGVNHRIQVVHLDPTITESDDVFNVREPTGDEYGVLGDAGSSTLTARERKLKKLEDERRREITSMREHKRTENILLFISVCLLVLVILKFLSVVLKTKGI